MPELPVFNQHAGLTGRDGGPYLDQQEAYDAETRRARIEGREPNYEALSGTAGIPQVPAQILVQSAGVNSHPSQGGGVRDPLTEAVLALADSDTLVKPTATGVFPDVDSTYVVTGTTTSRDVGEDEDEDTVREEMAALAPEQNVPENPTENIAATTNENPDEGVTKNDENYAF